MKSISWNSVLCRLMIGATVAAMVVWAPVVLDAAEPTTSTRDEGGAVSGPLDAFSESEEMPDVERQLRITGSTLKPRSNGTDYAVSGGGGCVYVTGGSHGEAWNTPLFLPQGATVTQFRLYFDDTSAADMVAWFTVYDLFGDVVQEFSASSFWDTGTGYSTSDPINHQIDYGVYSYVMNWRPNDEGIDMQLCGFRVYYTTP